MSTLSAVNHYSSQQAAIAEEMAAAGEEMDFTTYRNLQILEGNLEYVEDHRHRLEQLRGESSDGELMSLDIFAPTYLFHREVGGSDDDYSLAKKIYDVIKKKRPSKVDFEKDRLHESVGGHTCSAMALDFISRYMKNCSTLTKHNECKSCVEKFKPFYRASTKTYGGRQAAYNTIKVDHKLGLSDPELIKHRKIQSLANYHDLKLNPVTKTIKMDEIYVDPENFKNIVHNLPNDFYVIRAISPADNYKMEYYGHTMILIKGEVFSVYYDNADGAVEITNDVPGYVKDKLVAWSIPEIRIYQAKPNSSAPENIATEYTTE